MGQPKYRLTLRPLTSLETRNCPSPPLRITKHQSCFRLHQFTSPPDCKQSSYLPEMLLCLFSPTGSEKNIGRVPQKASKPQAVGKSSRKLFPFPPGPGQRSLGSTLSAAADGSGLRILTGLSQLCSLSSRALWHALCLPHLAVAQSSGPRLEGTVRPPRVGRVLLPAAPTVRGAGPASRAAPSPAPAAARRIQAGPSAAGHQPGHVRPPAIGPRERGRAGEGGKGRVEAK